MSGDGYGPVITGGRPRSGRAPVRPLREDRPPDSPSRPGEEPASPKRRRRRRAGGRRRPSVGRVLAGVVGAYVLLLLALGAWAYLRLDTEPVRGLASPGFGSPTNVLVVGSDSREGMTREEQLDLSTGSEGGNLTDTILVLSTQGNDSALLAFPRDLYVTRCDGSNGRINAAVHVDGPSCLVETVTALSGLEIHHYVETRFLGFRDIVDAVGGVEMCLEEPIADRKAGIDLPSGCQTLDGGEALGYVRVRDIDDDFGRIERQQRFLRALSSEIASPVTLLNPVDMAQLAHAGPAAVGASDSVGPISLGRLGWGVRSLAGGAPTYTVPATPETVGGAAVLRPGAQAEEVFEHFRTGAVLDEDADTIPEE